MSASFTVNGRTYATPENPVVVVCVDGSEPDYHEQAMRAGRMGWLTGMLERGGTSWPAHCAMPTLTNPNNLSIATGRPPAVHGISGNHFFDPVSGAEVTMEDPRFLRAATIFAAAADDGLDVVVVTAKDKLRRLLSTGLVSRGGVCFSAERAGEATQHSHGITDVPALVGRPVPAVYSADLSEFTLAAGVRILADRRPDLMYLSLSDFVQHKHAPGTRAANDFYAMLDGYLRELDDLGATVVVTADHGMSAKADEDGNPVVVFLEDELHRVLGPDIGEQVRVVLPITDPYTVHHGALGSFASVYLPEGAARGDVVVRLQALPGIAQVLERHDAAARYALPPDRIGDVVVVADAGTALGRHAAWHDLSGLAEPLRSHGGLAELRVPFLVNRSLPHPDDLRTDLAPDRREPPCIRNYDAFWVATTVVTEAASSGSPR